MRAKAVRKELTCPSSSSSFWIRWVSSRMQFSDPHAGKASSRGCLSEQIIIIINIIIRISTTFQGKSVFSPEELVEAYFGLFVR